MVHRPAAFATMLAVASLLAAACEPPAAPPASPAPTAASVAPEKADALAEERHEAAELARARLEAFRDAEAEGTFGRTGPLAPIDAPGWAIEHVWDARRDDWEPALAASPRGTWIYQSATRYYGARACRTCPKIAIVTRSSSNEGRSWGPARFVCSCPAGPNQYDSLLEVAEDGTVYAAWLSGFTPGVSFATSSDHGKSWTKPVEVADTRWSDKPVMGISRDGTDVFIAFNGPTEGDGYVAQSHDGGTTFTTSKVASGERYFFAGGVWVSWGGTKIAFAENDFDQEYHGRIHMDVVTSADGGASWKTVQVDTVARQPDCTSRGCYDGFYGSVPAIAGHGAGALVLAYVGASVGRGPQRLYVRSSTDGGLTWGERRALSPGGRVNALSPTTIGGHDGSVRLWWMDNRTGRLNVWYRSSPDGGSSWSRPLRISNATGGTAYKSQRGFREMYGDYGEIAVTAGGRTVATWGEGPSYYGPGGVWFNRQA